MKEFVLSPFYPVSDKVDTSHRAGWARYWANELGVPLLTTKTMARVDELKKGDRLLCYHGMEFKGQMNLQSGLTDEILMRARRLIAAAKRGVNLVSLDQTMPDYGALLAARGMDPTSSDSLTKACKKAGTLKVPCVSPSHFIFGDSHALSLYRPSATGTAIFRNDSLTLHGALKLGLFAMLDEFAFETGVAYDRCETLTVYFGNIDVRHHLARQPDPKQAIKELVDEYCKQLKHIEERLEPGVIEIVLPLPIEDESRAIPKSGWYKNAPFAGQWSNRHQIRLELRDRLKRMAKKHGFDVYEHPRHFVDKQGKLTFEVMELPRSVHIRPSEYRLVQECGEWAV